MAYDAVSPDFKTAEHRDARLVIPSQLASTSKHAWPVPPRIVTEHESPLHRTSAFANWLLTLFGPAGAFAASRSRFETTAYATQPPTTTIERPTPINVW